MLPFNASKSIQKNYLWILRYLCTADWKCSPCPRLYHGGDWQVDNLVAPPPLPSLDKQNGQVRRGYFWSESGFLVSLSGISETYNHVLPGNTWIPILLFDKSFNYRNNLEKNTISKCKRQTSHIPLVSLIILQQARVWFIINSSQFNRIIMFQGVWEAYTWWFPVHTLPEPQSGAA